MGHEIVAAILDATAEILAEGGFVALTTNHLARRAGVSIGSLYHYFANKEAIITALAERMATRATELFAARRDEVPSASDKERVVRSLSTTSSPTPSAA
jgi:AcrR family transcriptional regulator